MYPLRDLEEQIVEYQAQVANPHLTSRDIEVLQEIEREQSGGFKRGLATLLVDLGIKIHPAAAIHYAASHEAA